MHLDLLDGVIHSAKLAAGIIAARLLATPCDLLERRLVSLLSAAGRFLLDRLRATAAAHCRHSIIAAGNPGASESQPSGSHAPVRRGHRTLLVAAASLSSVLFMALGIWSIFLINPAASSGPGSGHELPGDSDVVRLTIFFNIPAAGSDPGSGHELPGDSDVVRLASATGL